MPAVAEGMQSAKAGALWALTFSRESTSGRRSRSRKEVLFSTKARLLHNQGITGCGIMTIEFVKKTTKSYHGKNQHA